MLNSFWFNFIIYSKLIKTKSAIYFNNFVVILTFKSFASVLTIVFLRCSYNESEVIVNILLSYLIQISAFIMSK